jgi:RHS repeat-associated protein
MSQFTGKERDAETGLDYFEARYLSSAQGRFTSPDEPLADQDPSLPQSWNLYAYGRNNPLLYVDPTGRCSQAEGGYTDDGSGLFPGPCSGGQIGGAAPQQVNVNAQQGSLVDYFFVSIVGGINQPQIGQDPNRIYTPPILVYAAPGSVNPQKPGRKPDLLDYAACTLAPHDFVQITSAARQSQSDLLVGNNAALPAGPLDVNKKGTSAPKGSTNYVNTNGQVYAQSSALLAMAGSNWASDCLPLLSK